MFLADTTGETFLKRRRLVPKTTARFTAALTEEPDDI